MYMEVKNPGGNTLGSKEYSPTNFLEASWSNHMCNHHDHVFRKHAAHGLNAFEA